MPVPNISFSIALTGAAAIQDRDLNRMAKDSMDEELAKHHKQRIPGHFSREARSKYKHKPRRRPYMAFKKRKFGSIADLVKTGETRRRVTSTYRRSLGGAWLRGGVLSAIRGTLHYSLPFDWDRKPQGGGGRRRYSRQQAALDTRNVKLQDIKNEIAYVTDSEGQDVAKGFGQRMQGRINRFASVGRKVYYSQSRNFAGRTIH